MSEGFENNMETNGSVNSSHSIELLNKSYSGSIQKGFITESETMLQKPLPKSVSFIVDHDIPESSIGEISDSSLKSQSNKSLPSYRSDKSETSVANILDKPSIHSYTNLSQAAVQSSNHSLKLKEPQQKFSLANIPEVDENVSEASEDHLPEYYGWDGYEAKFRDEITEDGVCDSIPYCVPPWAKSFMEKNGVSPSISFEEEESKTIKEKIVNLMKKHKDLMLMKRVESKKQLIVEPSRDFDDMDTVKMRTKNTKYYMAPIIQSDLENSSEHRSTMNMDVASASMHTIEDEDSMSITKKTSRPQAKQELSRVLKSLYKRDLKTIDKNQQNEDKAKRESVKCPRITLSKIRQFVESEPEEQKIHEIIKIEKVPSAQALLEKGKPGSKYIINVPKSKNTDKPTVNVIKIKEKHKIRVDSVENITEKVTELHYSQGQEESRHHPKNKQREQSLIFEEKGVGGDKPDKQIKRKTKTPTETKTFEVASTVIPKIAPLIQEADKSDKVLLIQYDKKSKSVKSATDGKCTTQLIGVRTPYKDDGEMYLYGMETDGTRTTENSTRVEDVPPTLKDRVHCIMRELRDLTLKKETRLDITESEVQVQPSYSFKSTQQPSISAVTNVAMVQAIPEVKSAEVQVHQSQLETLVQESFMTVPQPTPVSEYSIEKEQKKDSNLDKDQLQELLEDLQEDAISEKNYKTSVEILNKDESVDKTKPDGVKEEFMSESGETKLEQDITGHEEEQISHEKERADELEETDTAPLEVAKEIVQTEGAEELDKKEGAEELDKTEGTEELNNTEIKPFDEKFETEQSSRMDDEFSISKETSFKSKTSDKKKEKLDQSKTSSLISDTETQQALSFKSVKKDEEAGNIDEEEAGYQAQENGRESENERPTTAKVSVAIDDTKMTIFTFPDRDEDIRSYEIEQSGAEHIKLHLQSHLSCDKRGTDLNVKESSKFLHRKETLRKQMNWTDDTIYMEKNLCPLLMRGLAETGFRRPTDPIAYLANCFYKEYHNREVEEQKEVDHEHLELAKAMMESAGDSQIRKKFNIRKYPHQVPQEVPEQEPETLSKELNIQREISQDA